MKSLLLIILLSISIIGFGQNLVPNPSFEEYILCPSNDDQVPNAQGWVRRGDSPDYFNSCSSIFSVPYNWGGYQPAATGNAYCGLGTYGYYWPFNIREFIQTTLISPLTNGSKYYISFKLSLSINNNLYFNCATNKIGALLSTYPYDYDALSETLPDYAHVYSQSVITDTADWVLVYGSFVSDSSYQYITLGNFFSDVLTDTIVIIKDSTYLSSYYFIDDICVSSDSLTCYNFSTGINTKQEKNDVSVFPNPTYGKTTIQFGELKKAPFIKIRNQLGQLVFTKKYYDSQQIELALDVPNGVYFLQIESEGEIVTKKIIKQ